MLRTGRGARWLLWLAVVLTTAGCGGSTGPAGGDGGATPAPTTAGGATTPAEDFCADAEIDPLTQECRVHSTPAGGVYSIATFLDGEFNPVPRDEATQVEIVEYDEQGRQLNQTLGTLGDG